MHSIWKYVKKSHFALPRCDMNGDDQWIWTEIVSDKFLENLEEFDKNKLFPKIDTKSLIRIHSCHSSHSQMCTCCIYVVISLIIRPQFRSTYSQMSFLFSLKLVKSPLLRLCSLQSSWAKILFFSMDSDKLHRRSESRRLLMMCHKSCLETHHVQNFASIIAKRDVDFTWNWEQDIEKTLKLPLRNV